MRPRTTHLATPPSRILDLTAEHASKIASFVLTFRQARFLATVMLHAGVFVGRQYAAFAGTHGQKVHDFLEKLLVQRFVTPIELGSSGRDAHLSRSSQATLRRHRRAGQANWAGPTWVPTRRPRLSGSRSKPYDRGSESFQGHEVPCNERFLLRSAPTFELSLSRKRLRSTRVPFHVG